MIWGEELALGLAGLGEIRRYAAESWLSAEENGQPVIRRILSGEVDIHTHTPSGAALIGRAGRGEILGLNDHLHPALQPIFAWKAASQLECQVIPWERVAARCSESTQLDCILQRLARIQLYGTVIATHPLFSCLLPQQRDSLFRNAVFRRLSTGERLIRRHGRRAHLYLLISGKLAINVDGKRVALCSSGEILGEMSLIGFSPTPTADVVAEEISEVIEFDDEDIRNLMQHNRTFSSRMHALIDSRRPQ